MPYEEDWWTEEAMIKLGGGFVKLLGHAARAADPENLGKIKKTWPEYWRKYQLLGEEMGLRHPR
jgi:hypothetical protein